jgi:hypothetical protein
MSLGLLCRTVSTWCDKSALQLISSRVCLLQTATGHLGVAPNDLPDPGVLTQCKWLTQRKDTTNADQIYAACAVLPCRAACMGFVYLNATQPAQFFIRSLLREKLRHLELDVVRYYNDQQHMNQALVDVSATSCPAVRQSAAGLVLQSRMNGTGHWALTAGPHRAALQPQQQKAGFSSSSSRPYCHSSSSSSSSSARLNHPSRAVRRTRCTAQHCGSTTRCAHDTSSYHPHSAAAAAAAAVVHWPCRQTWRTT